MVANVGSAFSVSARTKPKPLKSLGFFFDPSTCHQPCHQSSGSAWEIVFRRLLCLAYPSLWAAVGSIAPKIGCVPQTLLEWVKREEVDSGTRPGVNSAEAQRVKDLEREVKELRRANEILKLASAFFAQAELDRRLKS